MSVNMTLSQIEKDINHFIAECVSFDHLFQKTIPTMLGLTISVKF